KYRRQLFHYRQRHIHLDDFTRELVGRRDELFGLAILENEHVIRPERAGDWHARRCEFRPLVFGIRRGVIDSDSEPESTVVEDLRVAVDVRAECLHRWSWRTPARRLGFWRGWCCDRQLDPHSHLRDLVTPIREI